MKFTKMEVFQYVKRRLEESSEQCDWGDDATLEVDKIFATWCEKDRKNVPVRWMPEAKDSLLEVTEHFRKTNPKAVAKLLTMIRLSIYKYSQNPSKYPLSKDFPAYRELPIPKTPFVVWCQEEKMESAEVIINLIWPRLSAIKYNKNGVAI